MKSEITKRWYLIFLVSVLAIVTYTNIRGIYYYQEWKHPLQSWILHAIGLILELFVWYALIKENSILRIAVTVWACCTLGETFLVEFSFLFKKTHALGFYFFYAFYICVFLVMLIGGKKNIALKREPSLEISSEATKENSL